jgi:hypothetical protein
MGDEERVVKLDQLGAWEAIVSQQNVLDITYTLTEKQKQSRIDRVEQAYLQKYGMAFDSNQQPNISRRVI